MVTTRASEVHRERRTSVGGKREHGAATARARRVQVACRRLRETSRYAPCTMSEERARTESDDGTAYYNEGAFLTARDGESRLSVASAREDRRRRSLR